MTLILKSDATSSASLGNLYGVSGPSDYAALLNFERGFYRVRESGLYSNLTIGDAIEGHRTGASTTMNDAGAIVDVAALAPRITKTIGNAGRLAAGKRGLMNEPASTNYLLNSATPATQTVTLGGGTGVYTLSVYGSGSAAATGDVSTGAGISATQGNPVTITVTGAASVTVTVTGSLTGFQLEKLATPTSLIKTGASALARALDRFTLQPRFFNAVYGAQGTVIVKFSPYIGYITTGFLVRYSKIVGGGSVGTINMQHQSGASIYNLVQMDDASTSFVAILTPPPAQAAVSAGLGFAANNFSAKLANTTVETDITGGLPTDITRLEIGGSNLSAASTAAVIHQIVLYNRKLSDAELTAALL